jgi:hypothetical protein
MIHSKGVGKKKINKLQLFDSWHSRFNENKLECLQLNRFSCWFNVCKRTILRVGHHKMMHSQRGVKQKINKLKLFASWHSRFKVNKLECLTPKSFSSWFYVWKRINLRVGYNKVLHSTGVLRNKRVIEHSNLMAILYIFSLFAIMF